MLNNGFKINDLEICLYLDEEVHMDHEDCGMPYMSFLLSSICNDASLRKDRRVMPLYSLAAEHFHTTPSSIERSIRRLLANNGQNQSNGEFMFHAAEAIIANHLSNLKVQ